MHPTGGSKKQKNQPAIKTTPSSQLISPVNQATQPSVGTGKPVKPCPVKKHFVKVKLVYKDDQTPVLATACNILLGAKTVQKGPLGNGLLGTATVLDPGAYEVNFPDIDANEWEVG